MSDPVDISAEIEGLSPHARVYRVGRRRVKVHARHDRANSRPGLAILHVTGAPCGRDGKAYKDADGAARVLNMGDTITVRTDTADEPLETIIERKRLQVAARTARAEAADPEGVPGVGPL